MVRNSANSDNHGKVVTTVRFVGEVEGFAGNDYWEIDQTLVSVVSEQMVPICRDAYLYPLLGGYPGESISECIEAMKEMP